MTSEIETDESQVVYRSKIISVKPKRRFKRGDLARPEVKPELGLKPVFSTSPRGERMKRSGRPDLGLRRIIAPSEFSNSMPQLPKSPLLRRVIDFLKLWQFGHHGLGRNPLARQRVSVVR